MFNKQNKAFTGSKAKMGPKKEPMTPSTSAQAQAFLSKPPAPFANPQGSVHKPVPKGPTDASGDGKSKNMGGLMKSAPNSNLAATGNTVPGGYNKVVGGRQGQTHPKKQGAGHVANNQPVKKGAKFFGK